MNSYANQIHRESVDKAKKMSKREYNKWKTTTFYDIEKRLILRLLSCVQIATKLNDNNNLVDNYFLTITNTRDYREKFKKGICI